MMALNKFVSLDVVEIDGVGEVTRISTQGRPSIPSQLKHRHSGNRCICHSILE
jgi:hypothetical protein